MRLLKREGTLYWLKVVGVVIIKSTSLKHARKRARGIAVDTVITVKVFLIGFWMKRLPLA
jgi:hypothetical protein